MAGMAFINMYNSIVDTVNWISNVPNSILAFMQCFYNVNPGNFFLAVFGNVVMFAYSYPGNDLLMNLPVQGNTDRFIAILK